MWPGHSICWSGRWPTAVDREPLSTEVRCEAPRRFLCITREVFWQELALLPGVAEALLRGLAARLRNTNRIALEPQRHSLELAHLEKELSAARRLQESLLPLAPPLLPGGHPLQAASLMRSASAASGDLFDLVALAGDRDRRTPQRPGHHEWRPCHPASDSRSP